MKKTTIILVLIVAGLVLFFYAKRAREGAQGYGCSQP